MEVAGDQPDEDGAASPALTAEPIELEDGARCFCKPSRLFATFGAFRSHCAAKHAGLPLRPVRADGSAVPLTDAQRANLTTKSQRERLKGTAKHGGKERPVRADDSAASLAAYATRERLKAMAPKPAPNRLNLSQEQRVGLARERPLAGCSVFDTVNFLVKTLKIMNLQHLELKHLLEY